MKKIVVGMTGASGVILGVRLLEVLSALDVETHLVMSRWCSETLQLETDWTPQRVAALADYVYDENDLAAAISSGSFLHDGMVIVPCTMKTLASVACGFSHNLIARAADVALKERRNLIIVPRESPLSAIHLKNMLTLAELGVCILPPMMSFYQKPDGLADAVDHVVGRILDQLGIEHDLLRRWQ
ncbi:MAG: UbiX family flavin prenyltransferase [Oscillospiraceae bacterium]|nr:UbiX family flavin prenyltransferase [Oscillospiraceae bacterium]